MLAAVKKLWSSLGKRDEMGICSRCMPRKLSPGEKAFFFVLTAYAFLAIAPDYLRLYPNVAEKQTIQNGCKLLGLPAKCYPLGTLGFRADNNGKVIQVDNHDKPGPAWNKGIRVDDIIVLKATKLTERRAVNKFVFVASGQSHTLWIKTDGNPARDVEQWPAQEKLPPTESEFRWLRLAEIGAFFFIGSCAVLLWRYPSPAMWGLFFYSAWFNSGQYFFWYANLSGVGLSVFDCIQALLEALGLTGIMMFARYYGRGLVEDRHRVLWWLAPFLVLATVRICTFLNFMAGIPTEILYRVWFILAFVVWILMFGLFWSTYRNQVAEQRLRIGLVWVAAQVGLLFWLVADIQETISFPAWLDMDKILPHWLLSWLSVPDFLYTQAAWLPIALICVQLVYQVLPLRAIRVPAIFTAPALGFAFVFAVFEEGMQKVASFAVGALAVTFVGGLLHWAGHDWLEKKSSRRKHRLESAFKEIEKKLADAENVGAVDRAVLREPVEALRLIGGALYHRKAGVLKLERPYNRVVTCACGRTVGCYFPVSLRANDPILASLPNLHRTKGLTRDDWSAYHVPADLTTPAVAVPIGHHLSRVVLLSPHVKGEDLEPDERRLLDEMALVAGMAYRVLEVKAEREGEL